MECPYPCESRHPVVHPPGGCLEAVGEGKEDAGGCTEGYKEPHQPTVQSCAYAVIGEQWCENGEGKDGGCGQEDVKTGSAAEDDVDHVYEPRFIGIDITVIGIIIAFDQAIAERVVHTWTEISSFFVRFEKGCLWYGIYGKIRSGERFFALVRGTSNRVPIYCY